MLRLSGPGAVDVPDFLMALRTSWGVKGLKSQSRVFFRIRRLSCRWWRSRGGAWPVKRRQKALAMSNLEVRVLLPKVMGRFAGGLIFFPVSWPRMVQKRLDGSFGLAWVMWRSQVVRRAVSSSS